MQIILLGAAVLSLVLGEVSTMLVAVVLTVFNAVFGPRGESKARRAWLALEKMMKNIARVAPRRAGHRDRSRAVGAATSC